MKVSFSRLVNFTPKWDGNDTLPEDERCIVKLKPLEMNDLILLMDNMQAAGGGDVDPENLTAVEPKADSKNVNQVRQLVDTCGDLIPKYCEVTNLEDESGEITASDIVKYPFYMELTAEILAELGNISMPNTVEEKNSEPQPDTAAIPTQ